MYTHFKRGNDKPSPCYGCTKRYPGCACKEYWDWKNEISASKRAYKAQYLSFSTHGKPLANGNHQRQVRQSGSLG